MSMIDFEKVTDVSESFRGRATLWRLDKPVKCTRRFGYNKRFDAVIVSTASVPMQGPETYIFPASASATEPPHEPQDWGELPGSTKSDIPHRQAVEDMLASSDIEDKDAPMGEK